MHDVKVVSDIKEQIVWKASENTLSTPYHANKTSLVKLALPHYAIRLPELYQLIPTSGLLHLLSPPPFSKWLSPFHLSGADSNVTYIEITSLNTLTK